MWFAHLWGAELGQIGLVLVSGEKIHCHFPLATRQENEHNYAIVKTIKSENLNILKFAKIY